MVYDNIYHKIPENTTRMNSWGSRSWYGKKGLTFSCFFTDMLLNYHIFIYPPFLIYDKWNNTPVIGGLHRFKPKLKKWNQHWQADICTCIVTNNTGDITLLKMTHTHTHTHTE